MNTTPKITVTPKRKTTQNDNFYVGDVNLQNVNTQPWYMNTAQAQELGAADKLGLPLQGGTGTRVQWGGFSP